MRSETAARKLTYAQAIQEALRQAMEADPGVVVIGEGVPDPKAIFGTTAGLREQFGAQRVFDMPLSENGMTGVCIGAALCGIRPVMVHQRIDFALLAMDQLVNNAAKWHYMFNGLKSVPLVVRLIVGRGWGQGPQHSQSLQALFAHIPGLKVIGPATAYDAKGMLIAAIEDNNPVLFIEHRWLHNINDVVPVDSYRTSLDKARIVHAGNIVTIAAFSYMVMEALHVAQAFAKHGIAVEVIDLRSASPLDTDTVLSSVKKTGLLIVADTARASGGITAELITRIVEQGFDHLRKPPTRIALPDHPAPTSHFLANGYYPDAVNIFEEICRIADIKLGADARAQILHDIRRINPHDVPNLAFTGPF
ncbi:MAG: alpha-ketoacid dehydrogenase subunit beta [Gammaproteobacteria bacterium]|nr:alpha-ketoacid dehydrogenase subunit beta [Gammaproteobacteria bacterium]